MNNIYSTLQHDIYYLNPHFRHEKIMKPNSTTLLRLNPKQGQSFSSQPMKSFWPKFLDLLDDIGKPKRSFGLRNICIIYYIRYPVINTVSV